MGIFDWVSDVVDWVVDTTMAPINWVLDLFMPEIPDIPTFDSSTYSSDRIGNTISEGVFASRCYGQCKIGGNKIRFNAATDTDLRVIVAHSRGPVQGSTRIEVNDIEWSELTGAHTKIEYTGTRSQTVDARFSSEASAFRSIAYTAFTFVKNDKQTGYNPNITTVMQGLLCAPLAGGADAFTRNPAVILYDWYLNVEGYTAGDLDLNEFKSLEELCDEVPAGGTLPRYRFDYNIDTNMAINDAKKLIWSSFNGRSIMSQGKIKPVWDSAQMSDGAGSLTAKTVSHVFDTDNIAIDSFKWQQIENFNLVRVTFKDSATNYTSSSPFEQDEIDINENGEILFEEKAFFITDAEIARRRVRYKYNKKRYPDYTASFSALSGASDLEIFDLVTITHELPGWTTKPFIITNRGEDELGRMQFTVEAYYSGAYDDSEVATQANFGADLPNPFIPEPVTGITLTEGGFIAGDGSYIPFVTLTFTKPNNHFWLRGQVYTSTDGTNFTFYENASTGDGTRIDAGQAEYQEGDILYVKVLSENDNSAVQLLANVSANTEYIDGKTARPSNVTGFNVYQIGDIVVFSMDRPSSGTDSDFSHFDIREGYAWSSAGPIITCTQTTYPLTTFKAGAKTYWIKAIDTSGNESLTADSKSITLLKSSAQNDFYVKNIIERIGQGAPSQIALNYVFDYSGGFFITGTETMDDSAPEKMDDSATDRMWTAAYVSGYLETEPVDVGEIVSGKIFLDITSTSYTGGGYTIEYKTSTDDITYTSYEAFADGLGGIFRYIIFKISLTANTGAYPEDNIKVSAMTVTVDLPSVFNESESAETIAAGGTTITFATPYTTAESIQISVTPISSTALLATHETATITTFKAHLFDTDGVDVGGTASWKSEGF